MRLETLGDVSWCFLVAKRSCFACKDVVEFSIEVDSLDKLLLGACEDGHPIRYTVHGRAVRPRRVNVEEVARVPKTFLVYLLWLFNILSIVSGLYATRSGLEVFKWILAHSQIELQRTMLQNVVLNRWVSLLHSITNSLCVSNIANIIRCSFDIWWAFWWPLKFTFASGHTFSASWTHNEVTIDLGSHCIPRKWCLW